LRRLAVGAQLAAAAAPVPVTVSTDTVEQYMAADVEPFDAVVCSLVLCSVGDPESVLQELHSLLRPGGELRFLEHIASSGPRARLQKVADATFWPRLLGNCHTHRHTEESITGAGFSVSAARHEWTMPKWVPLPVSEFAIGRAVKQ
jgi:2-polyprenyl-3-methyl-5-hydroxy-6-metoxy-1,4-benzoquinol methylase